jgi:uncharacterized protein (TIGR03435 family)
VTNPVSEKGHPPIVTNPVRNLGKLSVLAGGFAAITLLVAIEAKSQAQSPPPVVPSFAAATIKPSRSGGDGGGEMFSPGRYVAKNVTVKDLIKGAYGIRSGSSSQIVGGPSWVSSARFDVEAKEEEPLPPEVKQIHGYSRLEIQALLADRFKLKIHHETRELPVYEVVVAKNGPKLTLSATPPPSPGSDTPSTVFGAALPTPRTEGWRGIRRVGRGSIKAQYERMSMFATNFLQDQPELGDRLVLDQTGLKGDYDFTLQWLPEGESVRYQALPPPEASWPSLFTALEEQLRLKLEPSKGIVDVIVIDSVTAPSEN